ncbi:MAG TPA: glycosyltransferase family 2 protein [Patescibacteria group bacterium]|nr:glycosyltransferase family 2 protein [Patescibacteria group bacterium]
MRISVLIATRNRRDDLYITLSNYKKQTYPDMEIVVVDNGSKDGTGAMIRENFPEVLYFFVPDNIVHQALNLGVELSSGDVIWRSDDDSFPQSPNAFKNLIELFKQFPQIHIIASNILNVNGNFRQISTWHPKALSTEKIPEIGYLTNTFTGAGAAIRREVFKKIGGFWNSFFYEELDFTARAIAAGFNARFFPNIITEHYGSKGERFKADRWVNSSVHRVRYEWRYFPFWRALGRFFVLFWFQLFIGIVLRVTPSAFFEGMFGMIAMAFATFRKERNVIPNEVLQKITLGESIWAGIFRFLEETCERTFAKIFRNAAKP